VFNGIAISIPLPTLMPITQHIKTQNIISKMNPHRLNSQKQQTAETEQSPLTGFGPAEGNAGRPGGNSGFAGFFYRADIWLDAHLNPISKNLLMEIYSLEQLPLGCIASNEHFAETLNIGSRTVGRYIKELLDDHYLVLEDFNGNRRKLRVNLDRLEPRQIDQVAGPAKAGFSNQIGDPPRQIGYEAGHIGQPTSPNWPHTIVTYYNQFKEDSISRKDEKLSFENLKKAKETQNKSEPSIQVHLPFVANSEKDTTDKTTSTTSKTKNVAKTKAQAKSKTTKPNKSTVPEEIPLPFDSKIFKAKWAEWLAYRKEIKKSYKSSRAIRQIFAQLARFEEAFVLELIDTSMANEWRGLVFPRTGELYEQWLQKRALAKERQVPKQGTGTRAKPQTNLIATTQESNSIYCQLQNLEKQQSTFETYPIHLLKTFAEQLRGMWKRAKAVEMHASEIGRINTLGHIIAELIEARTKTSNTSQIQNINHTKK